MKLLALLTQALRHPGVSLRLVCCVQLAVAMLVLASPRSALPRVQEVESTESEAPVEESVDSVQLGLVGRPVPVRRILPGNSIVVDTFVVASRRGSRPAVYWGQKFLTGHCLANGLRAPLRC